jgi:hypothetical protein
MVMAFNAHAEWISVDETLQHKSIKPTLCSEFSAANETDVSIDSETCIKEASFQVYKKYLSNHEGKIVVTLIMLKIRIQGVECDGKIKKTFGRYYVNHRGEVIYRKPRFEVTYVDNCELIDHIILQNSNVGDEHVSRLNRYQYFELPYLTRKNIEDIDLSASLELELDIVSINRYAVLAAKANQEKLGYLISYNVQDLLSDERFEVIARFDLNGKLIGLLEY